jgi:CDP-diacylglycerol--glycerol-3-phosphate 3-phosphatidyltransferase
VSNNAPSQHPTTTIWTPANIVTLIRILLVPVFFVAIISPWPDWFGNFEALSIVKPWIAALLFIVLACTDALDGYLARSRGEVTNFGKFMDPLADKILVAAALLALCELQVLPSWVALIILAREFIVSGLRMLAASEGVVIAASWYGKAKTVFQIIAIVLFIIKDSQPFTTDPTIGSVFYALSWFIMAIALVLTVVSMLDYLAKSRDVLRFTPAKNESSSANSGDNHTDCLLTPEITSLAEKVVSAAQQKGITLSTAESCTGGLIAGALTAIPGSSAVIEGGIVSYSNEVKQQVLKVKKEDLDQYGAVSSEVAQSMAQGSRKKLSTSIAVSVTGIAGPGGASQQKPVGTVWFGIDSPYGTYSEVYYFNGNRNSIRKQTVEHALNLFTKELQKF